MKKFFAYLLLTLQLCAPFLSLYSKPSQAIVPAALYALEFAASATVSEIASNAIKNAASDAAAKQAAIEFISQYNKNKGVQASHVGFKYGGKGIGAALALLGTAALLYEDQDYVHYPLNIWEDIQGLSIDFVTQNGTYYDVNYSVKTSVASSALCNFNIINNNSTVLARQFNNGEEVFEIYDSRYGYTYKLSKSWTCNTGYQPEPIPDYLPETIQPEFKPTPQLPNIPLIDLPISPELEQEIWQQATNKPYPYDQMTAQQALAAANQALGTDHQSLFDLPYLPDLQTVPQTVPDTAPDTYNPDPKVNESTSTTTTTTTDANGNQTTTITNTTTTTITQQAEQIDYRGYLQSIINNTAQTATNTATIANKITDIETNTKTTAENTTEIKDALTTPPQTDLAGAPTFEQSITNFLERFYSSELISSLSAPQFSSSGVCPVYDFVWFDGSTLTMDFHCQIAEQYSGEIAAMMIALFSFIALIVFLKA